MKPDGQTKPVLLLPPFVPKTEEMSKPPSNRTSLPLVNGCRSAPPSPPNAPHHWPPLHYPAATPLPISSPHPSPCAYAFVSVPTAIRTTPSLSSMPVVSVALRVTYLADRLGPTATYSLGPAMEASELYPLVPILSCRLPTPFPAFSDSLWSRRTCLDCLPSPPAPGPRHQKSQTETARPAPASAFAGQTCSSTRPS